MKKIIRGKKIKKGLNLLLNLNTNKKIGMIFSLYFLQPDNKVYFHTEGFETLFIVLKGKGNFFIQDKLYSFERKDIFKESPSAIHISCYSELTIGSERETEIALIQIPNNEKFLYKFYKPDEINVEHRGKGLQEDTAYRIVRTIFDINNAVPQSKLTVGEVVNFQGKWSSYPPHHHQQPEIYYYRFEPEHGYGHGEIGDKVYKIFNHDILCITDNKDHAQVSAPGYAIYYIWAIRHLEGNPYKGFEFDEKHRKVFYGK